MPTAIDYSAGVPSGAAIVAAGHSAAVRYVAPAREDWMGGKPLTRREADDLKSHGVGIVSNWEYKKGDFWRGFEGGVDDARSALGIHHEAGGPDDRPIFFSVDEAISLNDWNSQVADYFRGINSVLGVQNTGIYGSSLVCAWAIEDGLVGDSSTPGKKWAWQTRAWSSGAREPAAVLYQRVIDTASNPGPKVDGVTVDVSDILADDYGQWQSASEPPKEPEKEALVASKPAYQEIPMMGNSRSSRHGARVRNFLWHTQEADSSAVDLAKWLNNPGNNASYHYTVRDGTVVDVVDTDYAAWSVLDANPYTINLCFAGSFASWSREQWLQRENDIAIAVWLSLQDCAKYDFGHTLIPPPYVRQDGISDHKYVTNCLGIGTHTDVGPNFPWDVAAHYIDVYTSQAPPVVNMIDEEAKKAGFWLGERITEGENQCPDGIGRWAQFDNGYIYWTPDTGAHAVPDNIFEPWSELGWEAGPLGYPTVDHTVLPVDGEPKVGDVQAFEGGVMYRRYGFPGFWVHGEIGAYWAKQGYENSTFGWPTSNEFTNDRGMIQQNFENGSLVWASGVYQIKKHQPAAPDPETYASERDRKFIEALKGLLHKFFEPTI